MKNEELQKLVSRLAQHYWEDGLSREDLQQEAWLAVLEHGPSFSEDMGVSRSTFLGRRIRDRLRQFVAKMLDRSEVERYWEAPSIAEGPEAAIRAETKEECEALRAQASPEKFGKVRRVEQFVSNTTSLDAEIKVDSEGDSVTGHDEIGTSADQEALCYSKEIWRELRPMSLQRAGDALDDNSYLDKLVQFLLEGYDFLEIANKLGRNEKAVRRTWERAQKRRLAA